MKIFFRFLREYPKESVLAPLFKLLEAGFDLCVPLVVAAIIDRGIGEDDRPFVFRMCLLLVLFAFAGLLFSVTAQFFSARAAVGSASRLRRDLFSHIQSFTYEETDRIGTSAMITRLTNDVRQIQTGVNITLRLLLRSPIIIFGAVIMAFTVHIRSGWIFLSVLPLLASVVFGVMFGGISLHKRVQKSLDQLTGITRENLNGVRVIRAFGREEQETDRFRRVNGEQTDRQNRFGLLSAVMNPVTYILVNLAVVILLRQGALSVKAGDLSQGQVIALVNYMGQILVELVKLATSIITVTKAVTCGNRVGAVLAIPGGTETHPVSAPTSGTSTPSDEIISFRDVSLTYATGGAPALSHLTFSVRKGETIGIIGGTGSGKSSLVRLLPRLYEPSDGQILLDGQDIRTVPPDVLRARIGFVPQKAELFSGTIRSNLQWGCPDADDRAMWDALTDAQAADFVREKDGQLDAHVAKQGTNFSGGQKQRLTIARALIRKPDILILDDSSSALDFATAARLRKALKQLPYHPTVFLVSQRTSSVRHSDRILVMDDGCLVGQGTHEELLTHCEVYREIDESQFKGETDR